MATSNMVTPPPQGVQRTQRSIRFGRASAPAPVPVSNSLRPAETTVATSRSSVHQADEGAMNALAAKNEAAIEGSIQGASALDFMSDFEGLSSLPVSSDEKPAETKAVQSSAVPLDEVDYALADSNLKENRSASKRLSRARRFAASDIQSQPTESPMAIAENSRQVDSKVKSLELLRSQPARTVSETKRSMAAAKVLTPLVAAISFNPGSDGTSEQRTQGLTSMLKEVHGTARSTAEQVSEICGRDVPQWMVTQLMQSLAEVVAAQWQRSGTLESNVLSNAMRIVFSNPNEFAGLIDNASHAAYQEVTTLDQAKDRVTVSTVAAAWKVYDWVTHPQLAVEGSGASPSVFFTYGIEPMSLVNKILTRCVDEARGFLLNVADPDLRVSHLQASIGRMTALVGAEYVTQTRHIMTWIDQSESTGLREERQSLAQAQLETHVLPHVFEWARLNFIRIEEGAISAVEVLNGEKNETHTGAFSGASDAVTRDHGDVQ